MGAGQYALHFWRYGVTHIGIPYHLCREVWPLASLAFNISDVPTKMLGLSAYHGLLCLLGHT